MSTIAIIGDTHFGVRNDNQALLDNFKRFFETVFFPYLDEHQIKTVVHLGDLVDRRKYTNHQTAHRMRTDFLNPLKERNIVLHLLAGNHDTHFKNNNIVNAFEVLGLESPPDHIGPRYIQTYVKPQEIWLDYLKVLMLPWICPENEAESFAAIEKTTAKVCFAHLELKGFETRKGTFHDKGHEASRFAKFDRVFTGHFHFPSVTGNIYYLGSPFEITWADHGSVRGFHTLDTETLELTFIENPHKMFQMIDYPGGVIDEALHKNAYVKVKVHSRDNPNDLDLFIQKLEGLPAIDVQVIDTHLQAIINTESVDQTLSTLDILQKTIDEMDVREDYRRDLNELLKGLYHEAHILQS